jgi:hypothetical protein
VFIAKKFETCKILSKKFDIYCKIIDRGVGNTLLFVVLFHPVRVSNFSVNFIYSVPIFPSPAEMSLIKL